MKTLLLTAALLAATTASAATTDAPTVTEAKATCRAYAHRVAMVDQHAEIVLYMDCMTTWFEAHPAIYDSHFAK